MTSYSQITFTYLGRDKVFSLPFDFIDKDYISIGVNGTPLSKDNYEIDNYTVIINSSLEIGDIIVITRHTDISKQLVNFTGRNDLNSHSLNLANIQLLHTVQETMDLINHALVMDYLGQWDCKGLILRNVGWGRLDTDGVNLNQLKIYAENTLEKALEYLRQHTSRSDNPHNVTKTQIGLDRVNNTSDIEKPISANTQNALDKKVDKIIGKGLSAEDYTTIEKQKLNSIEYGAKANVQSDWRENNTQSDSYIKNKITKLSELSNDTNFISSNNFKSTDNLNEGQINKYDKKVTLNSGANIIISGSYPDFTISSTGSTTKTSWGGITGDILNQKDLIKLIQNNSGGIMWNELMWNFPTSDKEWSS